jgi:hypothetical protein
MRYSRLMSHSQRFQTRRPANITVNRATVAAPSPLDLQEQSERIKNLEADTDLKLQALRHANIQLAIAILAVLGTMFGVLVGAVTLYLDYREPPKPPPTFIFLSPTQNTVL